ncbi:MAG: MoaD/ThiS family protein [Gammaproteobacteria bacterium]|nr:MoaD/ThiS family protein [Gammaproteobacteria bacterium]
MITVTVEYYAELREQAAKDTEVLKLEHSDATRLYTDLKQQYQFHSEWQKLRLAVNHELVNWDLSLVDGDVVVFIPKVAGG